MDGFTLVLVLVVGVLAALLAVRLMRGAAREGGEYKPIVIDKRDARIPPTPISVNKAPAPSVRTKEPTGAPLRTKASSDAPLRTKPPSDPPLEVPASAYTSLSGPIDLALRLGVTSEVAIRPPLPAPEPVPPDQIAVAPESGLTIRKRTSSTAPPADGGIAIRTRTPTGATMPSVAAALASPEPVKLRGRVSYALTTAAFSSAGITANREDGFAKLVTWREVVGIVARRLPKLAPHGGAAFLDVVSTAGATLRILPWTEITGHDSAGDTIERMRAVAQLVASLCRDAQLDPATKAFLQGTGLPAQLPDEKTLAAHDAKLR